MYSCCPTITFPPHVQLEHSFNMSLHSLHFNCITKVEEFLNNITHYNSRVKVKTLVVKRLYGSLVQVKINGNGYNTTVMDTLFRIMCSGDLETFQNFLDTTVSRVHNFYAHECE